jgi:C1A family cysteine protease
MPPVWDQMSLGSCTGQAIAALMQYHQMRQKPAWNYRPSAMFIYYNERVIENTVHEDSGAQIRDGIKSVNSQGVCREDLYPYNVEKFADKPSEAAYKNAKKHRALTYHRLSNDLATLKTALATGKPFVFGFTVYENFESQEVANSGTLSLPKPTDKMLGGHAVTCCGYDDTTQRFTIRNSWGTEWGVKGYFTMPYDYLINDNLADDFWAVTSVTV